MSLVVGVIPARYASTRFPGKVLAPLGPRSLLEQVWQRARAARRLDKLVVAVDDERVLRAAEAFGAEAQMTDARHASGTDRVAEVVRALDDRFDRVINIQADEPLITPSSIDRLVQAFESALRPSIVTLAQPIDDLGELFDANVVKVVRDRAGKALYFSRSPVPYHRGGASRLEADFRAELALRPEGLRGYWRHQGIYGYRRRALLQWSELPPSQLERDEGLEQLRALEAGLTIQVVDSDFHSLSVDTPADLETAAKALMELHG